jgi:hypothetical protein
MDINGNGTLDKEEMTLGLTKLGLNIVLIGKVLSVFDRDCTGDVSLLEWFTVLGQDV